MSKTATVVNQKFLTQAINEAEVNGPCQNKTELWKAAADIYNQLAAEAGLKQIGYSVVYLRVIEWKIPHKTVAGKRGPGTMSDEQKALMLAGRTGGGRRSRGDKFAENPGIVAAHKTLRQRTIERCLPLVDQIEAGRLAAAVKLNCLECCCYVTKEVRLCVVTQCPMWAFRPYQGAVEADEDTEVQEAEVEENSEEMEHQGLVEVA